MKAAVYSFSRRGAFLSKKIRDFLISTGYEVKIGTMPKYAAEAGIPAMSDHNASCAEDFVDCDAIVFVGSVGIAVRTIAPFIKSKLTDPAIISMDECGTFIIPILSGHIGGANDLARRLAEAVGGQACVTTATDVNGLFSVDEWAARNNMVITSLKAAKDFAAALVDGHTVGFFSEFPVIGSLPNHIIEDMDFKEGMAVTIDKTAMPFPNTLLLLPKIVHLGIGCRRDVSLSALEDLVLPELEKLKIDMRSVAGISSIDIKKDEQGLLSFAKKYNLPVTFYSADELNSLEGDFSASAFVESVTGVGNVCERSAVLSSSGGRLILPKTTLIGATLAVAVENITLCFAKSD